jgi:hypothetical protein
MNVARWVEAFKRLWKSNSSFQGPKVQAALFAKTLSIKKKSRIAARHNGAITTIMIHVEEGDDSGARSDIEAGGAEYSLVDVAGGRVGTHIV